MKKWNIVQCSMSNVVDRKSSYRWEISFSITHMRGNRSFYPLLSHSNSMQTKWLCVLCSYPVCVCICVVLLHLQKAIFNVATVRWWRCFSFHLFCFTSPTDQFKCFHIMWNVKRLSIRNNNNRQSAQYYQKT